RAVIRHREPLWRQQQYCHRGGRASPDGYTLLLITVVNALNTTMFKLNFDFIRDIAPVASMGRVPFVMEVPPSVPAKTVAEFIAYAKGIPCRRRTVQDAVLRRSVSRALPRCASISRSARRRGASLFRSPNLIDRVYQGRQATRLGGHHDDALASAARRSGCERNLAGLVWHRRSERHARGGHR